MTTEEGPWLARVWTATNPSADYWEIHASLGGAVHIGSIEVSTGYNLVKYWHGEEDPKPDHEWMIAASVSLSGTTVVTVDFVYGHRSGGSYVECGLAQALPSPGAFDWAIFGAIGWDFGYASADFDGISHAHLGTEIALPLGEEWVATAFYTLVIPFEDVKHDGGASIGRVGAFVSRSF